MKLKLVFCLMFLTWFVSIEAVPIENFIPFGSQHGDTVMFKNDDSSSMPISISTRFPFFNQTFSSVIVNTNGLITFDRPVTNYRPSSFPSQEFSGLSPFWNDIDTTKGGDIFYREVNVTDTLNAIAADVRRAFSQYFNYRPTFAFVVTWLNVASYSGNAGRGNTFQSIIATNGKHSFAIFNFHKLQWSISGNVANHAQVGFNAGDGIVYYSVEGSLTPNILTLTNRSNVNNPGKWIFKIDNEAIIDGGCNTNGFITIRPNVVSFVGDQDIQVSGPCFNETDQVVLYFQNDTTLDAENFVKCTLIDRATSLCRTKFIQIVGNQEVRLMVNGNQMFVGNLIVRDLRDSEDIAGLDPIYELESLNSSSSETQISWQSVNDPSNTDGYMVVYSLIDDDGRQAPYKILKAGIPSTATAASIDLNIIKQDIQRSRGRWDKAMAVIRVVKGRVVEAFNAVKTKTIRFVRKLTGTPCVDWHREQPDPWPIMNSLPPCRPTMPTSWPDTIDGFETDSACNGGIFSACWLFHPGSHKCYRDVSTSSSASNGATRPGQQCCYDKNGVLKVGPPGGGTLDIVNPANKQSHFDEDVWPWFLCCKLSADPSHCGLYYEKRPSDDGSRWRPPVTSGGSGDPHFLTLDGTSYTFNGQGEYALLKIEKIGFEAQVRLMPYKTTSQPGSQAEADGTVFSAIAVKAANCDSVQLELLSASKQVVFYLNGVVFDELEDGSLPLKNVLVSKSRNTHFIQYSAGISIEVSTTPQNDALLIVLTAPREFNGLTKGLLGLMDGNKANDFLLPSGSVVDLNPDNDREVYQKFAKFWQTTNQTSIFAYMDGFEHASYVNEAYVPKFMSDGIQFANTTLEQMAKTLCKDNQQCLFDIATTQQVSLGNLSVQFESQVKENDKNNEISLQTCVRLNEYFEYGRRTVTFLDPGYEYTAKCDAGYSFKENAKAESITFTCKQGKYDKELPKCVRPNSAISTKFSSGLLFVLSFVAYYLAF